MSYRWQNVVINPTSTIKNALEIIDGEALRVALVVDDRGFLLGVVTDGDIRRGLLKNLTLSAKITEVMNHEPVVVEVGTPRSVVDDLMESKNLLSIPLLDKGKIVGLETIGSSLRQTKHLNPVFVMAGGFGTRLRPLTDSCPKPMLKVGDKPILETVIRSFMKAGFVNFYISTHYLPEKIQEYFGDGADLGVNIIYVHEESPLGTGGALGLLPDTLPKGLPLIMMNGDILTKVDPQRLLEFHSENNADVTMCVREYQYQIPYGVVKGEGNKLISMEEKPIKTYFVNAGIYVVSPTVIKSVAINQVIDMPTLLEQHMKKCAKILMFPIHEYWLDIGRMDEFKRAQTDIYKLGVLE